MKRVLFPAALAFALLLGAGCSDQDHSTTAPHPLGPSWVEDSGHAAAMTTGTSGRGFDCFACHDEERWNEWGEGIFYCHNCHTPPQNAHEQFQGDPNVWMDEDDPNFHGNWAEKNFLKCAGCHGMEGNGENTPDCFGCHFGAGFTFENHKEPQPPAAHRIPQEGLREPETYFEICRDCHESVARYSRDLGLNPPGWDAFCANCHHPAPETTDDKSQLVNWLEDDGHQTRTLAVECTACHDYEGWNQFLTEPQAGALEDHCHMCHEATDDPHDVWPGNWVSDHPEAAEANFLHCAGCHGEEGGNTEIPNCITTCHFPGWLPEGTSPEDHGEYHKSQGEAPDNYPICADCHAAVNATQMLTAPECNTCHATPAPHPTGLDWLESSGHPSSTLSCDGCHDPSGWTTFATSKNTRTNCHQCHLPPDNAHEGYANWEVEHRDYAKANFLHCAGCHGLQGQGTAGAPDCFSCHFGPGWTFANHTQDQGEADHRIPPDGTEGICSACHEAIRNTGVMTAPACSECHD